LLTDLQIDRYSRQIILPEVGGLGQERLLSAGITLLSEFADLKPALEYLAGAGIGTIRLDCPAGAEEIAGVAGAIAELNPEVRVEPTPLGAAPTEPAPVECVRDESARDGALIVLAGSDRIIANARRLDRDAGPRPMIFARLGEPRLIAVLTGRHPCLRCAGDSLLGPLQRGPLALPVAMVAVVETIKCLLDVAPGSSRLIEFSGYESRSRQLEKSARCLVCGDTASIGGAAPLKPPVNR
jgi:adenylyltransferase/sulfurtransferase